jgi:hypothetical protein
MVQCSIIGVCFVMGGFTLVILDMKTTLNVQSKITYPNDMFYYKSSWICILLRDVVPSIIYGR